MTRILFNKASFVTALGFALAGCVAKTDKPSDSSSSITNTSSSSIMSSVASSSSLSFISSLSSDSSLSSISSVFSNSSLRSSSSAVSSSIEVSSESSNSSSSSALSSSPAPSSSSIASSSSSSSSTAAPDVSCALNIVNDGPYFSASPITISNNGSSDMKSWEVHLDFPFAPTGFPGFFNGGLTHRIEGNTLIVLGEFLGAGQSREFQVAFNTNQQAGYDHPTCIVNAEPFNFDPPVVIDDVQAYFDERTCGVGFDAVGNGSYDACVRLENGQAACVNHSSKQFQTVTWSGGGAIDNVMEVSASGESGVTVITEDGAIYGGSVTSVSPTPIISSGGITATGGRNTQCAMIRDNDKNDVRCWSGNGSPTRPNLPDNFDAMQLSTGYGIACALNRDGAVWCWDEGGNVPQFITSTPAKVPFSGPMVFISAVQDYVCGIKASGGLDCNGNWTTGNAYIPSVSTGPLATDRRMLPGFFIDAVSVQASYANGVVIDAQGNAWYIPKGTKGMDDVVQFNAGSDYIAGAGDRGAHCAVTRGGDIYCMNNGNAEKANGNLKAEAAACPY